jgi:two-component system alkaline phosphatase synthesis response regulator PhoP
MASHAILAVDDDPAILDVVAQVLADEGYEVLTAGGGRAAVDIARKHLPRLILLDLMMPEMNGWQVVAELRASPHTSSIPIVLLSARRDTELMASDLGVSSYLEKPFDLDELLARVQRLLTLGGSGSIPLPQDM